MDKEQLKLKYNKLLEREKKAVLFFSDDLVAQKEKDKYLADYKALLAELGDTLQKVGFWTSEDLENGFGKEKQDTFL